MARPFHPDVVRRPINRATMTYTIRNVEQSRAPPKWFPDRPRESFVACVAKLPPDAEERYGDKLRKRAAHEHAVQFVARVKVMTTNRFALRRGNAVPDAQARFETHNVT